MPPAQKPPRSIEPNNITPTHSELPLPPVQCRSPRPRSPCSPRSALSLSPDPSSRYRKKWGKNVHWASSVVDNEYKMQSRPKKPSAAVHPVKSQVATQKPSEHLASTKAPTAPTANTSNKMIPPTIKQPSGYHFTQGRRPSYHVTPTHSDSSSHHAPTGANFSSRRIPYPTPGSPLITRNILPAVPDAPEVYTRAHHPPPAPRPSRLPTPDLQDISEDKFFVPKNKLFDIQRRKTNHNGRLFYPKAYNQLRDAIAYIEERKGEGK